MPVIVWSVVFGLAVASLAELASPGAERFGIGVGVGLVVAGLQLGYERWPPAEPWSEVPARSVRGLASKVGIVTWIAGLIAWGLDLGRPGSLYVAIFGGMLFVLTRATGYLQRRPAPER